MTLAAVIVTSVAPIAVEREFRTIESRLWQNPLRYPLQQPVPDSQFSPRFFDVNLSSLGAEFNAGKDVEAGSGASPRRHGGLILTEFIGQSCIVDDALPATCPLTVPPQDKFSSLTNIVVVTTKQRPAETTAAAVASAVTGGLEEAARG